MTKQERWNQRAQDRQVYKEFLEEHQGTGKFSGKYALKPQQTELIWTMPWGCWIGQIYGQRATLSVDYKPGDWDSVQA